MNLLNLFRNYENVEQYSAGQKIFDEGQPGDVMYVVLEGEVEIMAHDQPVGTVGPGDLLGEMALIDSKPRAATAVALSDCRLAPVNEKRFLFMVQETPFFALHVMRSLVDKLRLLTLKV
jgi:CRP-like cAMP-binding protein